MCSESLPNWIEQHVTPNVTSSSKKLNYTEHIDFCQYAVMTLLGNLKEDLMTSAKHKFFHSVVALRS